MKRSRHSFLLDTHIFIWNTIGANLLSNEVKNVLDDVNNKLYLSRISLIELALKDRVGDLKLKKGWNYEKLANYIGQCGIKILEVSDNHIFAFNRLICKEGHKDPFDHLLISQAITNNLCLISGDGCMPFYAEQGLELLRNII